jgi:hypothetical protein
MAQASQPVKILKVGIPSDSGMIYKCDAIEYEGKMWLVPEWLDVPARGVTKPRRIIRMDLLPHQKMSNPGYGMDYVLNGYMPKDVLEGKASPQQERQYEIVELPEIELPKTQKPRLN